MHTTTAIGSQSYCYKIIRILEFAGIHSQILRFLKFRIQISYFRVLSSEFYNIRLLYLTPISYLVISFDFVLSHLIPNYRFIFHERPLKTK